MLILKESFFRILKYVNFFKKKIFGLRLPSDVPKRALCKYSNFYEEFFNHYFNGHIQKQITIFSMKIRFLRRCYKVYKLQIPELILP